MTFYLVYSSIKLSVHVFSPCVLSSIKMCLFCLLVGLICVLLLCVMKFSFCICIVNKKSFHTLLIYIINRANICLGLTYFPLKLKITLMILIPKIGKDVSHADNLGLSDFFSIMSKFSNTSYNNIQNHFEILNVLILLIPGISEICIPPSRSWWGYDKETGYNSCQGKQMITLFLDIEKGNSMWHESIFTSSGKSSQATQHFAECLLPRLLCFVGSFLCIPV